MKAVYVGSGILIMSTLLFAVEAPASADPTPVPQDAPTPPPPKAQPGPMTPPLAVLRGDIVPHERYWDWDLNIEGAAGRLFPDGSKNRWTGFGRIRAGVLHQHDSFFIGLGPTYEISDLQLATFGLQADLVHLESGFWGQVGGLLDTHPHPGFMAAAGYSLLGVEVQGREYNKDGIGFAPAVYLKLRAPIGILHMGLKHKN